MVFCLMCAVREGSKTSAFRVTNAGPCRANAGEWSDGKNTLKDPEDAAVFFKRPGSLGILHARFSASDAPAFIPPNASLNSCGSCSADVEKMP